jgi:hypothetical protein
MKKMIISFLILFIIATVAFPTENVGKRISLQKALANNDTRLNVNRINAILRNNGVWCYNTLSPNDGGLWWPNGTQNMTIYGAGQMVGALVNGVPRIAGVVHDATEFQPGMILTPGLEPPVGDNRLDEKYRWYTLKSDGTGDWNNWPIDQGAPVDKNGKPLLIGDQTIFSVFNDAGEHTKFSTLKLGVEIRQTAWAFNRADVIGDMIFIKWQLVNKSANNWDETYFVIWSDPDLGDGWDDFVGCDTTRGLAYVYNADNDDPIYGAAPPACGVDFFQGPIVDSPGDTVKLPDGSILPNKKMLKMTSFIYYDNNDSPQGNPQTGGDIWNFMRGYWRDSTPITFGGRGTDPTAQPTKFMFSGDPETASGWNDSQTSDRRFQMATGPYRMEKWQDVNHNGQPDFGEPGVQEIVAGIMVGRGGNNFNSVTYLKAIDEIAQLAYDINFALPRAPKAPVVQVSQGNNAATLSWDDRSEFGDDGAPYSVADIVAEGLIGQNMVVDGEYATVTDGTYDFTGYTIFQFSDAGGSEPVLIERLGVEKIADATPYTGARHIRLSINKHPKVGSIGDPLVNGKTYYFGIQANSYCKFAIPQQFPSPLAIVAVTPQNKPGVRTTSAQGDTIQVTHTALNGANPSDGSVLVTVVDPAQTTGGAYTVNFNSDLSWNLVNAGGDSILKKQTNQRGDDAYTVKDGVLVKVVGPDPGINMHVPGPFGDDPAYNGFGVTNGGNRWVSWADGGWGLETANNSLGNGFSFWGTTLEPWEYVNVELRWAGTTDHSDNTAEALAAKSKAATPERWSKAVVYRRDLGYGVQSQLADVPFAVYDTESNRRLKIAFVEDARPANGSGNFLWDLGWDGAAYKPLSGREYTFILNDTYDENYTEYISSAKDGTGRNTDVPAPVMYAFCLTGRGTRPYLEAPFELQIYAGHINTVNDRFAFTAPARPLAEAKYLQEDLKKINVVPNPYYGYHSGEINPFSRWVQFTNLPAKCTIRIFDLVGNLVCRLEKDDATATLLRWDLKNAYQLPVASGIYVYHVDVPQVGQKVGKLAVFTPNERLDAY